MEPLNIDQDILSPTNHQHETKLCIIIDSKTPIIMKVPLPSESITLGQFKKFTSLTQDGVYKFYFKSQDSEFGVVKEEVVEDDSSLPVDGDRIVAWVISNNANNQSSLFGFEGSPEYNQINNGTINQDRDTTNFRCGRMHNDLPTDRNIYLKNTQLNDSVYVKVQLKLDNYNFLGLTLVGPSDENGSSDGGIHVGEIAKDSVVEQDGRIDIGDRIIEINGLDVRDMRNDDAVAIFRSCVERRGAINLVLQRNLRLDSFNNRGRFTLPREYVNTVNCHSPQRVPEPKRPMNDLPIPPKFDYEPKTSNIYHYHQDNYQRLNCSNTRGAHSLPRSITPSSLYATGNFENNNNGSKLRVDSRSVYEPTTPTSIRQFDVALHCAKDDIQTIYAALKNDAKSLDIKDREWLKVVVKDAFLGSVLVKWLTRNVYGFGHKREVKRFANQMLILGLIRNPITSGVFSEKCYYTLS